MTAKLSEQYTEEYMMKKAYEHEAVITLDEMPDLKAYPISESFNK
jgi:mannan endo-1,4-beta-mannosidase